MSDRQVTFRRLRSRDLPVLREFLSTHWGEARVVAHNRIYFPEELDGVIALDGQAWVGLATFVLAGNDCEIVSLDSLIENLGIGTALVQEIKEIARQNHARRLWLITTNDNLRALSFYQKRGFELVAVHRRAVETARKLKPSIPLIGHHDIPIRDEIELELSLTECT